MELSFSMNNKDNDRYLYKRKRNEKSQNAEKPDFLDFKRIKLWNFQTSFDEFTGKTGRRWILSQKDEG